MRAMRKMLIVMLMLALSLPVWSAAAAPSLTTEQKYDELKAKGIFSGFSDGSARLNEAMTREQFAAVLFRLWGLKEEWPAKATFNDVLRTRWSFSNVEAVNSAGLMKGTAVGKFSPATPVTIEQLATVLVRAYGYDGVGYSLIRGKSSAWARNAISLALDNGFIPESADYTAKATRALLVEAAYAAYQKMNASKLDVTAVQPLANASILVSLRQPISSVDLSHFSLRDEQGGIIAIYGVAIASDGKSLTLTTAAQSAGLIHTLYVDGNAWRYSALALDPGSTNPGDTTRPYITSVTNTADGVLKLTFNEALSSSYAVDPANYDVTRGDLDLLSFDLSSDRRTVVITTSNQQDGYSYRLTVRGVRDLSGNVMTTRTDVTFNGVGDYDRPTVKSVTAQNNSTIKVVFSERVDLSDAKNTANYKINNGLSVTRVAVASDGYTVTLYTNTQKNGQEYRMTIRNIADLAGNVMLPRSDIVFTGTNDHDKPYVRAVSVQSNSTVLVEFNEKVDPASALVRSNYTIDNGLSVTNVVMDADGDGVLLTTSKQKDAVLYNLTVKGVADLAGNVMEKTTDLWFGGLIDRTAPTIAGVQASAGQLVLTFSERLDSASATRTANYKLDGNLGGTPKSAKYDDAAKTVTLATAAQTPGAVYTVTVNGVLDLSGNAIAANTKLQFVGSDRQQGGSISLQKLETLNRNTVQATFSRALYDSDLASFALTVLKDNNRDYAMDGMSAYVSRKAGADNAAIVQFRTKDSGNPSLFVPGHVYIGSVTGVDGLVTDKNANQLPFPGTEKLNDDPYATKVVALNSTAIKVTFSEPVRNVDRSGFVLLRSDGSTISIADDGVGDRNRVVTEATLYLNDELRSGQTYRLQFKGSITDAAGWNAIQTRDGDNPFQVVFAGTSTANPAPRVDKIVSVDRYTFTVQFTEPVRLDDARGFSLYSLSDRDYIGISPNGDAVYSLSDDRTAVAVYLNAERDERLPANQRYRLEYDANVGRVVDDQGEPLRSFEDGGGIAFTSNGLANSRPSMAKIEARGTAIAITFSEPITGYTNQTGLFDIFLGGRRIVPTSGALQDPRTIVLKVPALPSGQIGNLSWNDAGVAAIRDYNRLGPDPDEHVDFGIQ